nr:TonB-dependent receptor [Kingella potus]
MDYAQEKWGAGTKLRWATKQNRTSSSTIFQTPGYGVWDTGVWYKPVKNVELSANIYNIGDKKYWQHADVAGLQSSALNDTYTDSGRNFAIGAHIKF